MGEMNFSFAHVEKEMELLSENLSPKKLVEERGEERKQRWVGLPNTSVCA